MRPVVLTQTGTGSTLNSSPVRMDWRVVPFNVSLALDTNGATTGWTVQYTMEDPTSYSSAAAYNSNAKWFDHPFMAALTADTTGNIAFPVQAIRLQSNTSGTDTATLTIIQGSIIG